MSEDKNTAGDIQIKNPPPCGWGIFYLPTKTRTLDQPNLPAVEAIKKAA